MSEVEAAFLQAIQADPDDDMLRTVYADWLDQLGDPRGEYLRVDLQVHRGLPRLAELARQVDPQWLVTVMRRFSLVLSKPTEMIGAIKTVREVTGLGLRPAKDLVDAARIGPTVIARNLAREAAEQIAMKFEGHATAELVPSGLEHQLPAPNVSVVLVGVPIGERLSIAKLVRELVELSLPEAVALVDRVIAGTPVVLRASVDAKTAAQLVQAFDRQATLRIEPAQA